MYVFPFTKETTHSVSSNVIQHFINLSIYFDNHLPYEERIQQLIIEVKEIYICIVGSDRDSNTGNLLSK